MVALEIRDVSHRFAAEWVLLHVDGALPVGGRLLLQGANGSGKTTLLRLLATAIAPSFGTLRVGGFDAGVQLAEVRAHVGLFTHQHHFYEPLSGRDNLLLLVALRCPWQAPNVPSALTRVGLAERAHRPVATFSAGMKRRLGLARLLLMEPQLLLLDEPFSALDAEGVSLMEGLLDEWAARGQSWVMATHDLARGERLSTHVLHLRGGASAIAAVPTGASA